MTRFFTLLVLILLSLPVSSMAGVALTPVGTYATGIFDEGASEIVAYDPGTEAVFIINAHQAMVEAIGISDPATPTFLFSLDVSSDLGFAVGGVNSVDVKNGIVAVATENADKTMNGYLVFYDTAGTYLGFVNVGVLPDAVKFSPDGTKLVVANEGEPVGAVNPPGSISVVDISGGVAMADSHTLGFGAFDGRETEFLNKGLKLESGVPMSLDLEPEFPAISPDGTQAFVTLQEANAFAVVDLDTPEIVDVLPLGLKDYSKGQPVLDLFGFGNLPLIGIDANKLKIKLGGFSGLHYDGTGKKGSLNFLTVSDRGPNGADVVDGARTFNLPNYQARVTAFEIGGKTNNGNPGGGHHGHNGHHVHGRTFNGGGNDDSGKADITKTIYLTRHDGKTPITGLPNIPGFDEIPVDAKGNPVKYDRFGADLEGIVRDPLDGSIWMVDEYRPSIYHFSDKGRMIVRLVPENTHLLGDSALKLAQFGPHANDPGFYGMETLPEVYSKRRSNRGFEGVALDPDKRILYAFIQSPMENPDTSTRSSHIVRILAVDVDGSSPDYLKPVAEYVYLLERPVHSPDDVDKIGDATYIGDDKFLVLERDSALDPTSKKFVFEIELKGATNIRNNPIADDMTSGSLEKQTADSLAAMGIKAVFKRKVLNLPSIGYLPSDKSEGVTMLPDGRIAVMNDNDFGIEAAQGLKPVLGLITFGEGNMLDASDKDSGINIANWPVLGMYQPDGIDKYTYNGNTYYVTGNEGDTRDPEEVRVKNLNLDPVEFPNAATLQLDENLGRLKSTNVIGDIDGDGAYDRIYSFGARSFSIWDSFGNLVFDSSDDFENITADAFPAQFNSDNDDNDSFDSRSDDKGPEPEGVAVGKVGLNTYAFIGLERMGGIMVYDVTNPNSPEFVDYVNNRNFSVDTQNPDDSSNPLAGDLGPEGLFFVPSTDSPNGKALLIVGNEVSGTTTVYEIDD